MSTLNRILSRALLPLVLLAAWLFVPTAAHAAAYSVLVFSKTAGFRHDSIPAGITAIQEMGAGWRVA